jgi:ribonucleoside-diphosphate reductase alpha chain
MRYYKKTGPQSFSESTKLLKSILNSEYFNFIMNNSAELNSMIVSERDYTYDIFAVDTFLKSYLLRIKKDSKTVVLETPQYLFLRVAVYLWFDSLNIETSLQNIHKMYTELSEGMYIQASPTLFNAGRVKSQLSSCFTMTTDDNMESITKSWRDAAFISMNSGGIGFDYSSLRHSEIGDFGTSGGIVPWIKVMNQILSTVDQCLSPDTIIYTTNKGPIPISDVTPGDLCIRSDGKLTEVMRTIIHPVTEDMKLF